MLRKLSKCGIGLGYLRHQVTAFQPKVRDRIELIWRVAEFSRFHRHCSPNCTLPFPDPPFHEGSIKVFLDPAKGHLTDKLDGTSRAAGCHLRRADYQILPCCLDDGGSGLQQLVDAQKALDL
jgi:hypothetical protein